MQELNVFSQDEKGKAKIRSYISSASSALDLSGLHT